MIKWILNRVPRGVLQRLAGWAMPLVGLFYAVGRGRRGQRAGSESGDAKTRGVECPLCGGRYRRFMPYGYVEVRRNALCPRCLSLERHRLLWLWLQREGKLTGEGHFLHIAPEVCLSKKFETIYADKEAVVVKNARMQGLRRNSRGSLLDVNDRTDFERNAADGCFSRQYVTADLESPLAKMHFDVQNIPLPDGSFDVVFCNHVLEHVADDRAAMREMYRVMRAGGWGVMLSPVDEARAATFEDDTVTDPAERTRIFGQYDHRRVYGRDYAERLREAGWEVEEIDYLATLTPEERERYALRREILYVVEK